MVFVGEFSDEDLKNGVDKKMVEDYKIKTGLNYTNTKLVKKNGKIVAIKIWVCDSNDFEL